ncbi:MAG: acyl-CoA synthetase [Magnetospirillum gryphiswaldense]|nr:acyl-CoA synthetase [Magnetospirillum gryphiswaldense]
MTVPRRLGPSPDLHDEVVALRGGHVLFRSVFEQQVGGAALALAGCPRVVLVCRDSWNFAVALLAALTAGAEVVLPANDLPTTLGGLDGRIVDDGFQADPTPWVQAPSLDGRVLFQTSGSTGAPKLVVRSLRQLMAEVAALEARLGEQAADGVTLSTVPHQHAFGLVFTVLWPLTAGRPFLAVRQELLWEDVLAALPAGGILVTSPAHLSRMGGLPSLSREQRPNLILSAGAELPENAATEAQRILGLAVTEIYGSTETGAVAVRRRDGGETPWHLLPEYTLNVDPQGIWHLVSEAASAPLGDRLEPVAQGGFRLLGRADRIVKIDGKRVSLNAVVNVVRQLPQVAAAAVVVLPGKSILGAVVVLSEAGRQGLERHGAFRLGRQLRAAMADRLENAGLPRRWRFVDTLPQGSMGKCTESDLLELFANAPRVPEVTAARTGDDGAVVLTMRIPETLYWFQGHFPGCPILPGVVQLDWVLHFARTQLGLDVPAAREFQVKYTAVVEPGHILDLELRHDAGKGRVVFTYRRGEGKISSGTIYL